MLTIRRLMHLGALLLAAVASLASAQTPQSQNELPPAADVTDKPLENRELSDAQQLAKLRADLAEREKEYTAAVRELAQLNSQVKAKQQDHESLGDSVPQKDREESASELAALESQRELAEERVDLAISERKAVQALIAQLEKKIEQEQQATAKKLAPQETPTEEPTERNATVEAAKTAVTGIPATTDKQAESSTDEPLSARVAEAKAEATKKSEEALAARQAAQTTSERKRTLEANIELERQRLANSYKRHDNLSQTLIKLEEDLFRQIEAGKTAGELAQLTSRRDETRGQLEAISQDIKDQSARVEQLQSQLLGIEQEQLLAAQELKARESEAQAARYNQLVVTITDYAIVALPRIAIILLVLFGIYYVARLLGRRLIEFLSRTERGTADEVQYRTQTLTSVFENAVTTALWVIGSLMVLDTLRVPVSTLLGGVAVAGLAVAFGAQNLIRDYFTGFMILLEDQYKINDVVTINNMTGQVERITLRITVLRDFEGKVYFIPNGLVASVINLTHDWSRVVLDIPVGYPERVERVLAVLFELAQQLASEPAFKSDILREPEVLGVEKLSDSAVVVRLCLVTRPSRKDTIRREMLRRIKGRFDEQKIEFPYPQQTVHLDYVALQGDSAPPHDGRNGNGASNAPIEQA